jgi:uncharacterized coiled-coil protein SlyX
MSKLADTNGAAVADAGPGPTTTAAALAAGMLSPPVSSTPLPGAHSSRSSIDVPRPSLDGASAGDIEGRIAELEQELAIARQEKDAMENQYRNLLGKLTAMRKSLGDKLKEDAVSVPYGIV